MTRSKKTTIDGIEFHSQMEARYYQHLKTLIEKGEVLEVELQPSFLLQERFTKNKKTFRPITYTADFKVTYIDRTEIVDVKGRKDESFKLRHKLFEYKYRDLSLILLTDELKHGEFISYSQYLIEKRKRKRVKTGDQSRSKVIRRKGNRAVPLNKTRNR